jgi:hypothetical protein
MDNGKPVLVSADGRTWTVFEGTIGEGRDSKPLTAAEEAALTSAGMLPENTSRSATLSRCACRNAAMIAGTSATFAGMTA